MGKLDNDRQCQTYSAAAEVIRRKAPDLKPESELSKKGLEESHESSIAKRCLRPAAIEARGATRHKLKRYLVLQPVHAINYLKRQ